MNMESKTKAKVRQDRYNKTEKGKTTNQRKQYRYGETVKGRAFVLYASAKQRAEKRNLPFSITQSIVEEKLRDCHHTCEITGTPLSFEKHKSARQNPFAPSLDQKVAGDGYTPNNIQIVAFWYNRMKSDLTDSEAVQILLESNTGIQQLHG